MKTEYQVTVIFDATKTGTFLAESPEEAANMAYDEIGYVSLCHYCSREVEIADSNGAIVFSDDDEVYNDTYAESITTRKDAEIKQLNERIEQLTNELKI